VNLSIRDIAMELVFGTCLSVILLVRRGMEKNENRGGVVQLLRRSLEERCFLRTE
jgi:hypothetical protein